MKLIAIYARVSTAKQEEEQTIKSQIEVCREFAKKHDYTVVREYTDEGWSGDMLARPALDTLRQDVKSKKWEAVLIYDPDRLARRYSYQELVMDELREAGIEVLFVTVTAPKNSEDKILHGVRGIFAEYERAKINERFRIGKLRKVKEGHLLVSQPLYGYRYIPKNENTHGYYEVNENEATVVKLIFNSILEGLSIKKVIRKLYELGIKPRHSQRGVWSSSTISRLLRHGAYIGQAHWGSTYGVVPEKPVNKQRYKKIKKSSRRIKPREEWFFIPVPPIITKELFDRVQEQLKANSELSGRNKKNQYLLSGKIFCVCGNKRFGECSHGNEKHVYYRCSNRLNNFPLGRTCMEKVVHATTVDNLIWQKVKDLMTSPELLNQQIERWQHDKKIKSESSNPDIESMENEIEKLGKEQDRYTKAYGMGVLSIEKLKEYATSIRNKIENIENLITKCKETRQQINTVLPTKEELFQFTQKVLIAFNNPSFEMKRAVIFTVVSSVICSKESMQVVGHIPLTTISTLCYNNVRNENPIQESFAAEPAVLYSNYSYSWNSIPPVLSSNDKYDCNATKKTVIPIQFIIEF